MLVVIILIICQGFSCLYSKPCHVMEQAMGNGQGTGLLTARDPKEGAGGGGQWVSSEGGGTL